MGEDEFTAFASAHATSLVRFAAALCGDQGRGEEIAQEALERLYVKWARVDDPLSYARRSVVNLSRDRWRRIDRHERVGLNGIAHPAAPSAGDLPDRLLVLAALRSLPPGQRAVLVARYWLGLGEAQTAELVGVSVGTVKSQASRGLRRLRDLLGEEQLAATTRHGRAR